MTTNEDIITAIGEVRGRVETVNATLVAHVKQSAADAARAETRLNDHADRLRGVEGGLGSHLARHAQTRLIGGIIASILAAGGGVAAFWTKLTGGGA